MRRADLRDQRQAVAVGQTHVGQAQVVAPGNQKFPRLPEVGGAVDIKAHTDKRQLKQFTQIGFIVDNQHARRTPASCGQPGNI